MRILIVEDAVDMAEAVAGHLARSGMACDLCDSAEEAEAFLGVQGYDAIVLDINLPGAPGTELLKSLRAKGDKTPVLMLTALFSVDDRVGALDLGADDYLVKPFDQRELEARLRALIRRGTEQKGDSLTLGRLRYVPSTRDVFLDEDRVSVTRREAALLGLLLRHVGQPVSKERLYDGLFSFNEADVGVNAVELYIARLRKKLAGSGVSIATQRGFGYRIEQDG